MFRCCWIKVSKLRSVAFSTHSPIIQPSDLDKFLKSVGRMAAYVDLEDVKGPQTAAFNLPNDEPIVKDCCSSMVMLKTISEAKFKINLQPIANLCIVKEQRELVEFDYFLTLIRIEMRGRLVMCCINRYQYILEKGKGQKRKVVVMLVSPGERINRGRISS